VHQRISWRHNDAQKGNAMTTSRRQTTSATRTATQRAILSKDANVIALQAFGEAVNTADFDAFENLVAPDCVDHDPAPGQVPGPAGYRSFFAGMRSAFPDLHVEIEHLVADDDNVAFAYTLTGTNNGEFLGHRPTGRTIRVRGMQISRFDGGRMVERWGSSDELGIITQLGLIGE
jgi:steroid delta-isomerase-like uncharacterized protein